MTKVGKEVTAIFLLLNLFTIIIILLVKKNLPPVVPLFYGLPVSPSELTHTVGLTIPPVIASVLIAINFGLIKYTKDKFLEKILLGINIAITILSIVTVIKIILLVGVFT
jgi:hypothetical protein